VNQDGVGSCSPVRFSARQRFGHAAAGNEGLGARDNHEVVVVRSIPRRANPSGEFGDRRQLLILPVHEAVGFWEQLVF
jgi:hypothetical protein